MGTEQRGIPTTTAEELDNPGPRISNALIASHGRDRGYLERVRDQFVAVLEKCPACRSYLGHTCPVCTVNVQVITAVDKHLLTLPGGQEKFDLAARIAP